MENKPLTRFERRVVEFVAKHEQGCGCSWISEHFWPHDALWKRQACWMKMGAVLNRLKSKQAVYQHQGRWFASRKVR